MTEQAEGAGISVQHVHVVLADGRELQLQTANPDLVRFDITRAKHKWPGPEDAAMLWATFVAWASARRTGQYEGKWEDWSDKDCLQLEFTDADGNVLQDDDDPGELVGPTRTGPEPASV